jgi:hypothetical protein
VKGTEVNCTGSVLYAGPNGWFRVQITYNSTNTYTPRVVTGTATNTASFSGTAGDTVLVWGAQLEKLAAFASSDIPTGATAVTRAADSMSFAFPYAPQAMTVYADFVESGDTLLTGGNGVFAIGDSTNEALFVGGNQPGAYFLLHRRAGDVASTAAAVPTLGQRVELRGVMQADGSVFLGQSVDAAAEAVAATSAANAVSTSFSAATLRINGRTAGTTDGFIALRSLKIAAGVQSMATMRSL